MLRTAAALWGFIGVVSFLTYAVLRLFQHTYALLDYSMTPLHWLSLVIIVIFMSYYEGYKGFQKGFSPRVAARVLYLSRHANVVQGLFAPVFCMGYFGTSRRRQVSVIMLTLLLVILVTVVKGLPQPWRGIIDAGVVVGLTWGVLSFVIFVIQAFLSEDFPYAPEVMSEIPHSSSS